MNLKYKFYTRTGRTWENIIYCSKEFMEAIWTAAAQTVHVMTIRK